MWNIRDFWEWLAPGYGDGSRRLDALNRGGFIYYDQLSGFHDFLLKKEATSCPANVRVGLWAKRYMSTPAAEYKFLGTLLTRELFDQVVGNREPPVQSLSQAAQKNIREEKTLQKLDALIAGPYALQFTPERLTDAKAVCERNWAHFAGTPGDFWLD